MSLTSAILALFLLASSPGSATFEAGLQLRYQGSVSRVQGGEPGPTLKSMTLRYLVTEGRAGEGFELAYFTSERGKGSWNWPERFGRVAFDAQNRPLGGNSGPSALFDYDGTPVVLAIPLPLFPHPEPLRDGLVWQEGRQEYRVHEQEKRADRDCWRLEVSNQFGPRQVLWVEAGSDLLIAVEKSVFMGQGDEHRLTLALVESRKLAADELARESAPLDFLSGIQSKLRRGEVTKSEELTLDQLEVVSKSLEELQTLAEKTQTRSLVSAITRDVKLSHERNDEVSQLRSRIVGKAAPEFSLETLKNKPFRQKDLEGKVTVLHFWDYRSEPLVEPYGQVGYLDFLYSKRRGDGLQVYGVAVDARLGRDTERREAIKGIRKLRDFMNLSYPIALDPGDVLARFGDPQTAGAKLPLYVVVGPDGSVTHYSAGFYPLNTDEGLKPLEQAVDQVLQD